MSRTWLRMLSRSTSGSINRSPRPARLDSGAAARPPRTTPDPGRPKKRFFDPHTISIWAQNMSKRGGSPFDALRLILNRMEGGRAGHTTVLYNSALDICGHAGLAVEAAEVLQQMLAKNVRPNERTITSILNAIAEHAHQHFRGSSAPADTLNKADAPTNTRDALDTPANTQDAPSEPDRTDGKGFPGLEAFKIKSKREAVELGIKLYASWLEHSRPSLFAFNALLKVLWRADGGALVTQIFAPSGAADGSSWAPPRADIVTYSTAILACQSHPRPFETAMQYWRAFRASGAEPDAGILHALLAVMNAELSSTALRMPRRSLALRQDALRECKTMLLQRAKDGDVPPVETTNVLMDVACRSGCHREGIAYWRDGLLAVVEGTQSMAKARRWINERTIFLLFRQLIKTGAHAELLQLAERLRGEFGMHISTRLLNAMMRAARLSHDCGLAQRLFGRFGVLPDLETAHEVLLAVAEGRASRGVGAAEEATAGSNTIERLRRQHPQLMAQAASDAKLVRLLNRLGGGDEERANGAGTQKGTERHKQGNRRVAATEPRNAMGQGRNQGGARI